MTEQEALAEARRRWGPDASVHESRSPAGDYCDVLGAGRFGRGHSFEEAFAFAERTYDWQRRPAIAEWSRLTDGRLQLRIHCRLCSREGGVWMYSAPPPSLTTEQLLERLRYHEVRAGHAMRTDELCRWLCKHLSSQVWPERRTLIPDPP